MINVAEVEKILRSFSICRLRGPADEKLLELSESVLGRSIPVDYRNVLLKLTNGAELTEVSLLPVEDRSNRRNLAATWDSVARNNNHKTCTWFDRDPLTFEEFFIFAVAKTTCFSLRYKDPHYVWIWSPGDRNVVELDYSLSSWLEETAAHQDEI